MVDKSKEGIIPSNSLQIYCHEVSVAKMDRKWTGKHATCTLQSRHSAPMQGAVANPIGLPGR